MKLELTSDDSLAAIDKLCLLNKNQASWWNTIITQQSSYARVSKLVDKAHLVDMVAAFDYFCSEAKKLDATIELPNPCRITGVKNAHVVLDRILYL